MDLSGGFGVQGSVDPDGANAVAFDFFSQPDSMPPPANVPGPFTNPSWSDLPIDILLDILQRLELPQAIAFASVCTTWRAAASTAGIPHPSTPWIFSWGKSFDETQAHNSCSAAVTCNLYHPVDVGKSYGVSFPKGCFVACWGASHGWLILADNRASLVLYNPVTLARITLPPVTDLAVEAVYSSEGNLEHYRYLGRGRFLYPTHSFGTWFYQKAVLSCSPSKGRFGYVVMIIHNKNQWLSFVKAGQKKWQVASTLSCGDQYLDCVYHKGSFYTVTLREMVEKWHLDGEDGATREVVLAASTRFPGRVLTRHLVPTPWGDLLQVRAGLDLGYPDGIEFRICRVDPDARKMVVVQKDENVLMDHALFLGLNHSACLPTQNLPGIRPCCIYFSSPGMTQDAVDFFSKLPVWGGVRRYDLETRKFELAIPVCNVNELFYGILPSEVWITQNL